MSPLVQSATPIFNKELTQIIKLLAKIFSSSNIQLPQDLYDCLRRILKLFTEILEIEDLENKVRSIINARDSLKDFKKLWGEYLSDDLLDTLKEVELNTGSIEANLTIILTLKQINCNEKEVESSLINLSVSLSNLLKIIERYKEYIVFDVTFEMTQKTMKNLIDLSQKILDKDFLREQNKNKLTELIHKYIFHSGIEKRKILVTSYADSIKTTAKAILWEIDNYQEEIKYENKFNITSLLNYVKNSPGWVGDDFEECLEAMNKFRKL